MRKSIGCVAATMCAMGIAGEVVAVENNSSLAPLVHVKGLNMKLMPSLLVLAIAGGIVLDAVATEEGQKARPDPVTVQSDVIILTQTSGTEKVLQGCRDVESAAREATGFDINPSYIVFKHLGYQVINGDYNAPQSVKDSVKTSLFKLPAHGTLVPQSFNFWTYQGEDNYEGKDQATFLVEVGGKRYKVVVNYLVHEVVDQNAVPPECESVFPPSTTPTGGMNFDPSTDAAAFTSWLRTETLGNIIAATSNIPLNIADLPGCAVGQTVGEGITATITLDTNATGYGWFIDPTPADNSEFLPTSNPNEWVAKAGSEAAGKMDMLSVLLHEYGHALGIDHSADPNDYMGTTLTAGVRRLPSTTGRPTQHWSTAASTPPMAGQRWAVLSSTLRQAQGERMEGRLSRKSPTTKPA